MERNCIGYKTNNSIIRIILAILVGFTLVLIGIIIFIFIGGIVFGGFGGAIIGVGGMLVVQAVILIKLPRELVHIDQRAVYLRNTVIEFARIANVQHKGNCIEIINTLGGKHKQAYIDNCSDCVQSILNAVEAYKSSNML